jgi:hypothetical protein
MNTTAATTTTPTITTTTITALIKYIVMNILAAYIYWSDDGLLFKPKRGQVILNLHE